MLVYWCQPRLCSHSDNLTQVWETFDTFFRTDLDLLRDLNRTRTPARAPNNTASAMGDVSQTADVQLFHLDIADCPRSAGTVFRGVRGVVVGPSLNSSAHFPTSKYGYHCHWTIAVPDGLRVAAAIHLGNSSDKLKCNRVFDAI